MLKKAILLFKGFLEFIVILYRRRSLIYEMAKRDVATTHTGSLLGFFWTFVNPLIMILVLWFVFTYGFKTEPKGNVPFVVWLTAGMAIWTTFTEVVNRSTEIILTNRHLVKKVVFPLSILPVVNLVSSLITHSIFIALLIALIALTGAPVSLFWLQAVYYFFAMAILALGISWLASSITVFVRDMSQVVHIVLQLGFWATPIFWDPASMPQKSQAFIEINPLFYVVQGYRDSFIYFVPFWQHGYLTLYYWSVTTLIFLLGAVIFLRLRPHFSDVV